ncbi:hypothetical protein, partial [Pseudomonas kitaguniensis]|uniref:hypothetical protein n=2 Tax=Pseudomonadota TaxID=1224 RepID=UPI003D071B01
FFLWLDENGGINGTRCRDDFTDRDEPWQWHAYLPQRFLRVMLTLLPPDELARAAYARMTHDFVNFPPR